MSKRKHRNTRRITAPERVDAYAERYAVVLWASKRDYLIKAFADHARETLARYKRRAARKAS